MKKFLLLLSVVAVTVYSLSDVGIEIIEYVRGINELHIMALVCILNLILLTIIYTYIHIIYLSRDLDDEYELILSGMDAG